MQSLMVISPLPPSFLYTYNLSTPSFGSNALCIVNNFVVLESFFKVIENRSLSSDHYKPLYHPNIRHHF